MRAHAATEIGTYERDTNRRVIELTVTYLREFWGTLTDFDCECGQP
jgi:hypothetical protein